MISKQFWQEALAAALIRLSKERPPGRLAVIGIGHELRGDDAAGVMLVRRLAQTLPPDSHVLLVEAGHAPENHTGPVRRFAPGLVLLVDAAQMDQPPGTIAWLPWQETNGLSATTHTMPPYVLARYLTAELGCEVMLIGIQPAQTDFDAPLSPEVEQAVNEVAQAFSVKGRTVESPLYL